MSDEYQIVAIESTSQDLFDMVAGRMASTGNIEINGGKNRINVKDISLKDGWEYDIQLIRSDEGLDVTRVRSSVALYEFFKTALAGMRCEIVEAEAEDRVSIEQMFRVREK